MAPLAPSLAAGRRGMGGVQDAAPTGRETRPAGLQPCCSGSGGVQDAPTGRETQPGNAGAVQLDALKLIGREQPGVLYTPPAVGPHFDFHHGCFTSGFDCSASPAALTLGSSAVGALLLLMLRGVVSRSISASSLSFSIRFSSSPCSSWTSSNKSTTTSLVLAPSWAELAGETAFSPFCSFTGSGMVLMKSPASSGLGGASWNVSLTGSGNFFDSTTLVAMGTGAAMGCGAASSSLSSGGGEELRGFASSSSGKFW
mmetsp:Transcript_44994/g.106872  ORF Transcript_44994/g.106872 Transcript_44994/m.106872 type:complete len:256 (-) Transcript_44994:773-1540(-)